MTRFVSPSSLRSAVRVLCCASLFVATAASLTGCGTGIGRTGSAATSAPLAQAVTGSVHGGQQPVSGAAVYLFATGTTGYQSASTSLLRTNAAGVSADTNGNGYVTTGTAGDFAITGDYTCPSSSAQVYLLATGGNPGLSSGTSNASLAMMSALGSCGNLSAGTFIQINEVTTIAAVWALAPFMQNSLSIGAPSSNAAGLAEAFNGAAQLASVSTGHTPGPALPAGASISVAQVNTLADILASCINSAGGIAGDGTACGNLFNASPAPFGNAPVDTVTAALNIARSPGTNVSSLFALAGAIGPFQPTLSVAPNDWTLSATYAPAGLISPQAIAIDPNGKVFVADCGSTNCSSPALGKVVALSGDGSLAGSTLPGLVPVPKSLAIDLTGNIWVPSFALNTVTELNPTTLTSVAAPFTGGGMNAPNSIAIDASGQAWITNSAAGTVTVLSTTGAALTPSTGYTGISVPGPISITLNPH